MATPTLTDLLTIPSEDSILDSEVFAALRGKGVRVTDWLVGGAYRALCYAVAAEWLEGRTAISALAAAGLGDYVFGFTPHPAGLDVTSWATDYAKQVYGVTRIAATFTKRTIVLTNSTGTTYGPIPAGKMILQFASTGNRYVNDASITIAASTTTSATFRSEYAVNSGAGRAYTDSAGQTPIIVTSTFPGVVATNPATTFSPSGATLPTSGSGLGTVTPSGSPTAAHSVTVRIDSSGQTSAGNWSTSLDGAAYINQGAIATLTNLGGTGITLTPANDGGGANPSFIAPASFTFSVPGTDVTQVGRDTETPQELGTRCYALFPSLAFAQDGGGNWIPSSPTLSAYEALARSANSQVKVCFVKTDGTLNDKVLIYVAGQGAPLPSSVLTNITAFFASFTIISDRISVLAPTQRTITLAAATVKVKAAQLTAAQKALQNALVAYLGGSDANASLSVNGLVDRSYIASLMRSAPGVTHVDDALTINTVAADLQLPVTPNSYELAAWSQNVSTAFTWVLV